MGRSIVFMLGMSLLLTGCSKIRSGVHFCKEKAQILIRVLSSDVAKDCPDSVTFDNYPGFRDWYRFPVHYPYHFLMIDTLNSGTLAKYDGGDIRDPNSSSVSIDGCTNIIKLGWNSEFLIFERADQRFGLFCFASGQCRIFDSRAERDRRLAHPLPEENAPSLFFEKFRR